jgi:hypothetical protein
VKITSIEEGNVVVGLYNEAIRKLKDAQLALERTMPSRGNYPDTAYREAVRDYRRRISMLDQLVAELRDDAFEAIGQSVEITRGQHG